MWSCALQVALSELEPFNQHILPRTRNENSFIILLHQKKEALILYKNVEAPFLEK